MNSGLKAGLFVLAAIGSLVYMTTKITQNRFAFAGVKRYYARVKDATGLLTKSKIKMAGLDIGQIESIELLDKQARITMIIGGEVTMRKNALVTVKSIGFLGDKFLALNPGTEDEPVLEEGGYVSEHVAGNNIEDLTEKVSKVVDNLTEITGLLKEAMRGEDEDGSTRLDRIAENIEDFSAGLAGLNRLGDLTDKLNDMADDLKSVTNKVARGEGTVGKLLNDTETVDRINQAVSGVNKFLTKADKLQILLDARSGVLANTGGAKTMVSAWIQPTYDKYYLLGVTSSPSGFTTRTRVETVTNGTAATSSDTTLQQQSVVTFNVQFAKLSGDFIVKAGIFESTGGLGLDYVGLMDKKIRLVSELYNFGPARSPQLNLGSEFHLYRPFYIWGGGDDLLSKRTRNVFIGAGVRFSDSDIKTLLTTVPR